MLTHFLVEALLFLRGEARAQATTTQRRRTQAQPPTLENSRRLERLASHHLEPLPSTTQRTKTKQKKKKNQEVLLSETSSSSFSFFPCFYSSTFCLSGT
jgi:hypothetical protein